MRSLSSNFLPRKLVVAPVLAWLSQTGWALPSASMDDDLTVASYGSSLTGTFDFTGIVALDHCSGSIVRFDDSALSDAAIVLTNGHCVEVMAAQTVYTEREERQNFRILNAQADTIGSVQSSALIYATMAKTDLGLYRLEASYADLKAQFQVEPLTLARHYPTVQSEIEVLSGYWKRGYSCAVEAIVQSVREDIWTWHDSIRYSRPGCETIGGTSGSPIVLKGTRTVVGVNNTINASGERCTMDNPCEIDEHGQVFYEQGVAYGQQTAWLYSCRAADGSVDVTVPTCLLPRP